MQAAKETQGPPGVRGVGPRRPAGRRRERLTSCPMREKMPKPDHPDQMRSYDRRKDPPAARNQPPGSAHNYTRKDDSHSRTRRPDTDARNKKAKSAPKREQKRPRVERRGQQDYGESRQPHESTGKQTTETCESKRTQSKTTRPKDHSSPPIPPGRRGQHSSKTERKQKDQTPRQHAIKATAATGRRAD
ncbi:unnamed protein product [Pleuronectes platessa]|uniref:Uncharacterized protein n=1 Tax=Pleuronectes platessa TaxID=8262 RepID=A0A9N7YB21_PLEPL|nr:unnamed protein product [Pleuronectes platessa]